MNRQRAALILRKKECNFNTMMFVCGATVAALQAERKEREQRWTI